MSGERGKLDEHGQSAAGFRARENVLKTVEHLLGLCRGVLADGDLNVREIDFLATWMLNHQALLEEHPIGRLLVSRVARVVADGVITNDELAELKECLESVLGGGLDDDGGAGAGASSIGVDASSVMDFDGRRFVVTGKFLYGPRRIVEDEITRRGGALLAAVSNKVHYVVVGTMGSRDWTNSSFGTKLEKVYELIESGVDIRIVPEPIWVESLSAKQREVPSRQA